MKIRTDFVTNSSSSSFTITLEISGNRKKAEFHNDPPRWSFDGSSEYLFNGDLKTVSEHLSSVEELASWLIDSVESDRGRKVSDKKKQQFVDDAVKKFGSVRDISTITIKRHFSGWGECADLVADSDSELRALAKAYVNAEGIEKERAAAAMETYIQTATEATGMEFGSLMDVAGYSWKGGRSSLDKLAKRLCSRQGPSDTSGTEMTVLDMKSGKLFSESKFDLE